ncbi:Pentafunctional AROM polypeptide [Rhodotorula toruloides]|nr:Pentafunctional AROM polypeptide [Rhodotorula toruloides]
MMDPGLSNQRFSASTPTPAATATGTRPRLASSHAMRPPLYDPNATIVLIGMRGVGKTTLGLIAATSLRRSFIDADSAFQTLHGPISQFVTTHGWSAFRDAETVILKRLLEEHPRGYVIACGGGVVEREENRNLLQRFREGGGPIVHVVRDKEETVRYLVDEQARPSWGEEIRSVWARRTPYFESLCTHTIVSLTAYPPPPSPQFLMKHVETAFVRLLRSIFGFASSHVPLVAGPRPSPVTGPSSGEYGGYGACESELGRGAKGSRTSFVALNFPDLRVVSAETIRKVAGGVDVIEMRVDTLVEVETVPPFSRLGSPANGDGSAAPTPRRRRYPSPHFVAICFGHLRRCSPLPVLYTVRTEKQGGAFPDPYTDNPDLFTDYLALVELGFKLGAEYVDLELALPDEEIQRFLALRGAATQVLGADHDRKGEWRWDSQEVLDKYLRATRLGCDVIKLVSTPTTFNSNLELLKFRAKVDALISEETGADRPVPLLAINLGKGGQISRYLNPVLTPVTHPLLPGVAAPGQLTFAQTQQALYLSGLTLEKTFFVSSASVAETFSREAHTLGLPYNFLVEDRLSMRVSEPNFGGAYLGAPSSPLPVSSISAPDEVLLPAASTGWADLCVPACSEPNSYDVPPTSLGYYKHTNVRVLALAEVITQNLSPINAVGTHTCALLVGLAKKDRSEVVEALRMVGARWVFLLACEADEGDAAGSSAATPSRPASPRSPSRPSTPSGAHPPTSSLPYPQHAPLQLLPIPSFSAPLLYSKRPPTIIVSSDDLLVPRTSASPASSPSPFPESLFSSPTGGCALDLSFTTGTRRGLLANAIEAKRARARGAQVNGKTGHVVVDGWQVLGVKDVQSECERQAFRALTGRRMG